MAKRCYITGASGNYLQALIAQFNSLEAIGNEHDFLLISFRLPEEFLKDLKKYSFNIRYWESDNPNQIQATAIDRFELASREGKFYEAICLLDADMFTLANPETFFEAAARGMIITGSNGMVVNFNRPYQEKYGIDLGSDEYIYPKVHTTVPIFLGPDDLDWFEQLYYSRRIDHWDDFLYLNLLGVKMGKHERMIVMPPYCFTGIHHFQVKPETCAMDKDGVVLSGTEEQIYMAHGKYFDSGWVSDFRPTMERYFRDEQIGDRGQRKTWAALEVLRSRFEYFKNLGPLIPKNYVV